MAPSRGLQRIAIDSFTPFVCRQCQKRAFTSIPPLQSGHNRWSKIKHDKARVDASKNRQRSIFSQEIATCSKLFGPDPALNPKLHALITKAKREGFAKSSIEAAIARGQGRSAKGEALENVTVECMMPGGVAVVIECETDSKLRTLAEVRVVVKEWGGNVSPTGYLFEKKGRIVFEAKEGVGVEEVLEAALEAGAVDVVEDEEGRVVVWAESAETKAVGEKICEIMGLDIKSSEVVWDANEDTKVGVDSEEAAEDLAGFLDELVEKEQTVQSVAMNVSQGNLPGDAWKDLKSRLAS